MKIKNILFLFIGLLGGISTVAQNDRGDEDTLSTDDIVIVRSFEPTISNAIKITEEPEPLDIKPKKIEPDFDFIPLSFQSHYRPDTIKAARIKGEPLNRLYKNYLELGMGNYLTTYGKLRVNNTRSRNGIWGVGLDHRASHEGINDVPFSGFSRNAAEVHGTRFFKAHELKGEVNYSRDGLHYYGYPETYFDSVDYTHEDVDKDDIRRTYNLLNASASFKSFHKDSADLNYEFKTSYDYLFSNTLSDVDEHRSVSQMHFEKYSGNILGKLDVEVDYNSNTTAVPGSDSNAQSDNLLINLAPSFQADGEDWRASFGIKGVVENEQETNFHFYPDVHLSYNIYKDYVIPYAGVTGGMERLNLNMLRRQNPFVNPVNPLFNQNTRYDFYGGVRGAFSSQISFNAKASLRQVANHAFFAGQGMQIFANPAMIAPNNATFDVLYDTITITQLTGEVSYFHDEKINATLRMDYYDLDPRNLPRAWHMPRFRTGLTARYNLRDKIIATADVFFVSTREAPSQDDTDTPVSAEEFARELKPYVDINLGIDYRWTKKFSIFLRTQNMAAMRYEVWNRHPSQRFNMIAGFSYSFWGD